MSIELVTSEHNNTILNSIKATKKKISIVSPFIGFYTAKLLSEIVKDNSLECIIITRFYREDFLNNASSLEGLKILNNVGAKLYALQDLHSKLYLFDEDVAIAGSANFTMGGFKFNHELSFIIEDEKKLYNDLSIYFENLLLEIKNLGNYEITLEMIEKEIEDTDSIIQNRKDKNTIYSNSKKFGAKIKRKENDSGKDIIEETLKDRTLNDIDENIWLKFEGKGDKRIESGKKHYCSKLNNKCITCFPRNPRGIAKGDLTYLCAVSFDKQGKATPIIVGRARTKGFDKDNILSDLQLQKLPWLVNYPYYCELYDIEILDTEVKNGISLNNLIKELGNDLYPGSIGKSLSLQELSCRHYQKSHIRITNIANNFIDHKFNDLKRKYGIRNE